MKHGCTYCVVVDGILLDRTPDATALVNKMSACVEAELNIPLKITGTTADHTSSSELNPSLMSLALPPLLVGATSM